MPGSCASPVNILLKRCLYNRDKAIDFCFSGKILRLIAIVGENAEFTGIDYGAVQAIRKSGYFCSEGPVLIEPAGFQSLRNVNINIEAGGAGLSGELDFERGELSI